MDECRNCGAELKSGVKFCTKCGEPVDVTSVVTHQSVTDNNETMKRFKNHSMNYFKWFKESIISPSKVNYDNKYFGLVSLFINVILIGYALYVFVHQMMMSTMGLIGRLYSGGEFLLLGANLYTKLLFLPISYFAVFLLMGFACKKYLIDSKTDLFDYANQLAGFSNSIIILELILSLFLQFIVPSSFSAMTAYRSYESSFTFLMIFLILIATIWLVAYILSIVVNVNQMKWDKVYVAAGTLILNNIILLFVFKMIINSFLNQFK